MNPIVKNILAVIVGVLVGGMVNMAIITVSPHVIPIPDGIDPTDVKSLEANMHLMKPINFLMPFLAHAGGTLIGAFLGALLASKATRTKMLVGLGIGGFFLLGGIAASVMIPAPTWFSVVDILGAYIPMGWLGYKLASKE